MQPQSSQTISTEQESPAEVFLLDGTLSCTTKRMRRTCPLEHLEKTEEDRLSPKANRPPPDNKN